MQDRRGSKRRRGGKAKQGKARQGRQGKSKAKARSENAFRRCGCCRERPNQPIEPHDWIPRLKAERAVGPGENGERVCVRASERCEVPCACVCARACGIRWLTLPMARGGPFVRSVARLLLAVVERYDEHAREQEGAGGCISQGTKDLYKISWGGRRG